MKRRSNPISLFVMVALVGLLVSFLSGDIEIGQFLEGLEISSTEVLLEYITMGLGFLALAGVFIFFFIRATRDDKEYFWDFTADDFKDEEK